MTVRGFFFALGSFCLAFVLLRLGVQELSQLILCLVAMVTVEEVTALFWVKQLYSDFLPSTKLPPRYIYLKTYRNLSPMLRTLIFSLGPLHSHLLLGGSRT